jgi:branched-chain amino acid transport system substrate-binding protein
MARQITGHGTIARRALLRGSAAAGIALSAGLAAPALLAQSTKPVRIGLLNSFSKVFAYLGTSNLNGMNLYFEQIGWTAGGRKIELLREDDEVNPQVGLQKLRKLVESDKVDITCGPQASNVAAAILDFLKQSGIFHLLSGAGSSTLKLAALPYLYRTSLTSWQHNYAFGEWFPDHIAKEVVLTASDFVGGHGGIDEFRSAFVKRGGKVVKEIYPPLGTNDFSPYLADLKAAGAPASFSFYAGTDAVRFVTQYAEYQVGDKTRLTGSGFMLDSDTLPAEGKAALGAYNVLHYADTLDNPENQEFVKAYRAKFGDWPNVYAEYGYVTARVIAEILDATGGDTANKDRMAEIVAKLAFNAPRGPISFDPTTHNIIQNVYIRQVAEIDGRIANTVVATIPNVRDPGQKAG